MGRFRLRNYGVVWSIGSLFIGIAVTWIWMASQAAWQTHLNTAYTTGLQLYDTLLADSPPPSGVQVTPLSASEISVGGDPVPLPLTTGRAAHITSMSVFTEPAPHLVGSRLQLHIVSADMRYPVSGIASDRAGNLNAQLGNITKLLANYCSEPIVYARLDQRGWMRIDGNGVWGCGAAPRDNRLLALLLLVVGVGICLSQVSETASYFTGFANELKNRGRLGRHDPLREEGPQELRDIVRTVNDYLDIERDNLQQRALVLSGVSHDLGTPAARLRLRAALIEDEDLRTKLESDLDQMTGMIESVLTYTHAEISAEEPVQLSLTSLAEAVVADYEDVGKPVRFIQRDTQVIDKSRSVFGIGSAQLKMPTDDARRVLVSGRPISLQRALSNLIDNALKYGRTATVSVEANSSMASIIVEDECTTLSEDALNQLTGPFQRGENAGLIDGVGLGLTIVSTIARQHGGTLSFERYPQGLRAVLHFCRQWG
ncbi:sensor histidine kinase [Cochlodiniinecator piscidefendens]|uniref:sensor histidine kinase n=1 Tax=Cochlodiniinecator piscidefendens TaxID=2715756 RepID=UPI0014082AB4|nr:HAMP domain-containing sensor histidine kinase [Cochlodiniinecator piscidefendens]